MIRWGRALNKRVDVKSLVLASVFGAMSFAIRKFEILVIPMPVPPLKMDLRGVPAFVGSCLVPIYYAWFIGWAASGFDLVLEFGVDFTGWIPACIVCSWLYRRLRKPLERYPLLNPSLAILLGQVVGNLCFLMPFMYVYAIPLSQLPATLIILLARVVLTFIAAAPIVHAIERRLGKLVVD